MTASPENRIHNEEAVVNDVHELFDKIEKQLHSEGNPLVEFYGYLSYSNNMMTRYMFGSLVSEDRPSFTAEMYVHTMVLHAYFEFRERQPAMNDALLVDLVLGAARESILEAIRSSSIVLRKSAEVPH